MLINKRTIVYKPAAKQYHDYDSHDDEANKAEIISQEDMVAAQIQSTIALAEKTVIEGGEHADIYKRVLQGLVAQNLYGSRSTDLDAGKGTYEHSVTLSEARRISKIISQAKELAESGSEFSEVGKELLKQYQARGLYGKRENDLILPLDK